MDTLIVLESLRNALVISIFVFVMMVLVDYFNVLSKGRMNRAIKGGRFRQYTISSFLGSTPGCFGAFTNVSFYVHGLISFFSAPCKLYCAGRPRHAAFIILFSERFSACKAL